MYFLLCQVMYALLWLLLAHHCCAFLAVSLAFTGHFSCGACCMPRVFLLAFDASCLREHHCMHGYLLQHIAVALLPAAACRLCHASLLQHRKHSASLTVLGLSVFFSTYDQL